MTEELFRVEAMAFDADKLVGPQKDAIDKIAKFLNSAITSLGEENTNSENERHLSANKVLFLSGKRGMGKTSVLHSLRKQSASRNESDTLKERCKNLFLLQEQKDNIIWLDELNLDTLPRSTNLLVAILVRIETAVKEALFPGSEARPMGMLDPQNFAENILSDINRLGADFAITWDGNLKSRGGNIDPDTYAQEVKRVEEARLGKTERFSDLLNTISKKLQRPSLLFVLPVDDFDLNPRMSLELIKLIRMISAPRFCTILLGDLAIAEEMFDQQIAGDLAQLGNIRYDGDQTHFSRGIFTSSSEISSNAMRKLIPPSQRVYLEEMSPEQAFNFKPPGKTETISDLLKSIPLDIYTLKKELNDDGKKQVKKIYGHEITTFEDFLCIKRFLKSYVKPNEPWAYKAVDIFRLPVRHLCDLWMSLDSIKQNEDDDNRTNIINFVVRLLRQFINEDRRLSIRHRRYLQASLVKDERNIKSDWELRLDRISFNIQRGLKLEIVPEYTKNRRIFAFTIKKLYLSLNISDTDEEAKQFLDDKQQIVLDISASTLGAFMLFYDLFQLTSDCVAADTKIVDYTHTGRVFTQWQDTATQCTYDASWFHPVFRSYWKFSIFSCAWNTGLKFLSHQHQRNNDPEVNDDHFADCLINLWLVSCIFALSGVKCEKLTESIGYSSDIEKDIDPDRDAILTPNVGALWSAIEMLLVEYQKLYNDRKFNFRFIELNKWFINLVCLFLPETGLKINTYIVIIKGLADEAVPFPIFQAQVRKKRIKDLGKFSLTPKGISLLTEYSIENYFGSLRINKKSSIEIKHSSSPVPKDKEPFYDYRPNTRKIYKTFLEKFTLRPGDVKSYIWRNNYFKAEQGMWHEAAKKIYNALPDDYEYDQ